ncbi:carboxymuconolactone decarboxylase family protein [Geothrix sp. 21YS21S-4]|uniref:carboxymuconolactone decarboxylase family protein n=1 Tax=Geothrix sp. 21YS21S-4 TaxID=3068889 RepID=UPI0027BA2951|nr:carboxymuconolactone decarboxylase family protein [Geothrix sp. 21YS21S-4]
MSPRFDYARLAPAAVQGLGSVHAYLAGCGLAPALVELVYLRVSQINGCAFCIDMHSRDLLKHGLSVEKLMLVGVWREAEPLFDARERAALAWAETVTCVAQTAVPDAEYAAVAALFDEKELSDLTVAISLMNAYNRLSVSARNLPAAARAAHSRS